MTTTNYNIRLDQELKENAFAVFESYGLTPLSFEYQKVTAVSQDELLIYKEHTDRENR